MPASPQLEDRALLDAWRDGDEAAGSTLVERHFASVYRFFRAKLDADVEDLTQRVFVACLEGRARIRDGTSFKAYLFGIARNLLFRQYRERGRDAGIEAFLRVSSDDLRDSPSQLAAMKEEQKLLLLALRAIPIDHQITIELHYWEGLPVADVAAVLDIAEGTVKSRLHRAREQLKSKLVELATTASLLESTIGDLEGWARALRGSLEDA